MVVESQKPNDVLAALFRVPRVLTRDPLVERLPVVGRPPPNDDNGLTAWETAQQLMRLTSALGGIFHNKMDNDDTKNHIVSKNSNTGIQVCFNTRNTNGEESRHNKRNHSKSA